MVKEGLRGKVAQEARKENGIWALYWKIIIMVHGIRPVIKSFFWWNQWSNPEKLQFGQNIVI